MFCQHREDVAIRESFLEEVGFLEVLFLYNRNVKFRNVDPVLGSNERILNM